MKWVWIGAVLFDTHDKRYLAISHKITKILDDLRDTAEKLVDELLGCYELELWYNKTQLNGNTGVFSFWILGLLSYSHNSANPLIPSIYYSFEVIAYHL